MLQMEGVNDKKEINARLRNDEVRIGSVMLVLHRVRTRQWGHLEADEVAAIAIVLVELLAVVSARRNKTLCAVI